MSRVADSTIAFAAESLISSTHSATSICSVIIIIIVKMGMMRMAALAQIPISTFSHIWVFVCQYGIMFVIIVIAIIIIIIYRKVKVSTLKHV